MKKSRKLAYPFCKALALLLCLSLTSLSLPPSTAFAVSNEEQTSLTQTADATGVTADKTLPQEETDKRTATTKTFLMPDGTHTFVSYGTTVHKQKTDGTWEEVDNRLIQDTRSGDYVTANGLDTVKFDGDSPSVSLESEKGTLTWSVRPEGVKADSLQATATTTSVAQSTAYKALSREEKVMSADKTDGMLRYTLSEQKLRLDYTVSPGSVKENIVISSPESNRFLITLSCTDLIPLEKGEYISLTDKGGEEVFRIAAPYMFDSAGQESEGLQLKLASKPFGGQVTLVLTADEEWLKAEERVYPVTIDPVYSSTTNGADIIDTYVHEGDSAGDHYLETRMVVGIKTSLKHYSYVKVPLDDLPAGITAFNSATFKMYLPSGTSTGGPFLLRASNNSWQSSTISWSNQPNLYTGLPSYNFPDWYATANFVSNSDGTKTVSFNVLDFVNGIYSTNLLTNYGFRVSYQNESTVDYNSFYTAEWGTQSQRPQITVNYSAALPGVGTSGIYYIRNKGSSLYLTASVQAPGDTAVNATQNALYSSSNAITTRIRQMWKVWQRTDGKFTIRPYNALESVLCADGNTAQTLRVGSNEVSAGTNAWTATLGSVGWKLCKNGNSQKMLQCSSSSSGSTVSCGSSVSTVYGQWEFIEITSPPEGAYMYDMETQTLVSNPTRYITITQTAVVKRATDNQLADGFIEMGLQPVSYTVSSNSQMFSYTSSDSNIVEVETGTSSIRGKAGGNVTITAQLYESSLTTSFTVTVTPVPSGTYFMVNMANNKLCYVSTSGNVSPETISFSSQQKWVFTPLGDGYYSVRTAAHSSYYLGVQSDSTSANTPIVVYSGELSDGMKWKVTETSGGYYRITPKTGEPNMALALSEDNSDIQQRYYVNDSNRKDEWSLFSGTTWLSKDTTDEGVIEGNEDSAYWAEDPTYYVHNYNPSDSFHFESAVETAIDSWCSALGISMTPASEQDADICIYGGDEDTLRDKFKMDYLWVGSDAAAHCSSYTSLTGQNISVGGQNAKLKSMISAKIFIPNGNRTEALENDVVTHELGHALGFCGHSPNNDDVMYYQAHNFDQLSREESDFLKLMYLLGRDGA